VPREPVASVIRALNSARAQDKDKYVVSVDINSGMNGDTGEGELVVISDLTVSIGSVKQGLFKPQARARIGKLVNADIGIPMDWVNIDTLL
jgi:NAD(P)H-hydrate repair Nnr-like enzyme with NAD(P)H-hydrate epimerase domain